MPQCRGGKFPSGHKKLVHYECLVCSSSTTKGDLKNGANYSTVHVERSNPFGIGTLSTFSLPALAGAVETNSSPFQRPKLKITEVRTAQVIVHGPQTHIRIYTDQGIYGQGETTDAAIGTASLIHSWRRALIGRDPLNVEAIWERIRTLGIFAGAQGGQYITALSGLEIALWDLAGKALELPVYQLMGGKFRDKVRIYCDSDMDVPIGEESDRKLPWIKAQGFTAMKIDLDDAMDPARFDSVNWTASNGEIDRMVKWVAHVRESIPANMDLACDMHGRYDAPTGKKVAKALEPFRLMWLEEPVPPKTSTRWRTSGIRPRPPSPAARTSTCAGDTGNCLRSRQWTSFSPTSRRWEGLAKPRRSPTWRKPTTFQSRRTAWFHRLG